LTLTFPVPILATEAARLPDVKPQRRVVMARGMMMAPTMGSPKKVLKAPSGQKRVLKHPD